MLYRPKFCSECGEKIQRAEWRLTTSRQYCELCATEYPITNRVPLLSLGLCGVLLIAGAKTAFFPGSVNELQQTKSLVSQPVKKDVKGSVLESRSSDTVVSNDLPADGSQNASNSLGERVISKDKNVRPVFFCGAPTKKGTPCSRRVKTKGYCWQHKNS